MLAAKRVSSSLLLGAWLAACSDGEVAVQSLEAVYDTPRVEVGGSRRVALIATLDDGSTADFSERADWDLVPIRESEDPDDFATVDGGGLVSGVAPGAYYVRARVEIGESDGTYAPYGALVTIGFETVPSGELE